MNHKIFIFLFLTLVSGSTQQVIFTDDLLKDLPASELLKISVKSAEAIEGGKEFFLASKSGNLAKLDKTKNYLNWFRKIKLIDDDFINLAGDRVDEERKEIETSERLYDQIPSEGFNETNLESKIAELKAAEADAVVILKRGRELNRNEIEKVKNWLLTCIVDGVGICKTDISKLTAKSSGVGLLQKNPKLLKKLADAVKVSVWPEDLNFLKLLVKNQNDFEKTRQEMLDLLEFIRKDIKNEELQNEMKLRIEIVSSFLSENGSVAILDERLKAFERVINGLIENLLLPAKEVEPLKLGEALAIRKWLLINQMLYAVDLVSRSGGFARSWPLASFPGGYKLPEIRAVHGGYFGIDNTDMVDNKEQVIHQVSQPLLDNNLNVLRSKTSKAYLKRDRSLWKFFSIEGGGAESKPDNDNNEKNQKSSGIFSPLSSLFGSSGNQSEKKPEGQSEKKSMFGNFFGQQKTIKESTPIGGKVTDSIKPESEKRGFMSYFFGKKATETISEDNSAKAAEPVIEAKPADVPTLPENPPSTKSSNEPVISEAPKETEKKGWFSSFSSPFSSSVATKNKPTETSTPASTTTATETNKTRWFKFF